jgi:hypothetical protein
MRIVERKPEIAFTDLNMTAEVLKKRLHDTQLRSFSRKGPIELLFVVTPATSSQVYAPIKRYCDCVAGIASQCVALSSIKNNGRNRNFATNILMKINSKLGGVNVSIKEMPQILKPGTV